MSNSKSIKEPIKANKKNKATILIFIVIDLVVLILSIVIPLILVSLNQKESCSEHIENLGGNLWILGRALGFTTLIWFIFTIIIGANTKKIGKLFKSYQKAKNYHCFHAFLTNIIFIIHVGVLLNSDPWGPLIFKGEYNHIPLPLFIIKIWTGVFFAIIMVGSSLMFYFLRDVRRLKKFGYKRFIRLHHIMLLLTVFLAIHIFLINTELMIIWWG